MGITHPPVGIWVALFENYDDNTYLIDAKLDFDELVKSVDTQIDNIEDWYPSIDGVMAYEVRFYWVESSNVEKKYSVYVREWQQFLNTYKMIEVTSDDTEQRSGGTGNSRLLEQ